MNWFSYWLANIKWKYAVSKADKAHAQSVTKERYYVMPFGRKRLIIMNRKQFRRLKDTHYMSRGARVKDLVKESFYFTPDRGHFSPMTPAIKEAKRQMWIKYRFNN